MGIIKNIAGAFLWSRATYFYYQKEFSKSLSWYEKFKNLSQENKKSIALYATLLALNKTDSDLTKREFARSLSQKPTKSKDESEYIDAYCKLYIEIIESGSNSNSLLSSLKAKRVDERLRRLLPAPIVS